MQPQPPLSRHAAAIVPGLLGVAGRVFSDGAAAEVIGVERHHTCVVVLLAVA